MKKIILIFLILLVTLYAVKVHKKHESLHTNSKVKHASTNNAKVRHALKENSKLIEKFKTSPNFKQVKKSVKSQVKHNTDTKIKKTRSHKAPQGTRMNLAQFEKAKLKFDTKTHHHQFLQKAKQARKANHIKVGNTQDECYADDECQYIESECDMMKCYDDYWNNYDYEQCASEESCFFFQDCNAHDQVDDSIGYEECYSEQAYIDYYCGSEHCWYMEPQSKEDCTDELLSECPDHSWCEWMADCDWDGSCEGGDYEDWENYDYGWYAYYEPYWYYDYWGDDYWYAYDYYWVDYYGGDYWYDDYWYGYYDDWYGYYDDWYGYYWNDYYYYGY